ncbi:arylsulfatase [Ruegeria atlantica]|uniref:arylsulfatase n=1 Tax=Ruegeria atlantica TaxID=81569 RepID=UPI00147B4C96|nr:arylsulfatase [Ruegeria atlantica]
MPKTNLIVTVVVFTSSLVLGATASISDEAAQEKLQPVVNRYELPIPAPVYPPITTLDARDATPPAVFQVTAPKDAPNVVIVLIDDLGFGGTSTFGGVIETPELTALAEEGLRYTQFHTTALCSPTRQALRTGRNHHSVNQAKISETATSFPGATGMLPNDTAGIGTILRENGYSTAAFGKWHETAVWEISPSGPMVRWPNYQGFDEFYGFMGGETNQWSPAVFHNQNRVDTPDDPSYHFMNDMTTKAIDWIEFQQALTPDKPFFVYFAPGAVHAPHHVPQNYIDKHKGKFDEGWDVIRERIHKQQLEQGIIPKGTKLANKPDDIKDWSDLSSDEQKLFARQAEVFAAYLDMADHEIGRLLKSVDDMGELDNTLLIYIAGDNGTSAEGVMNGLYNELTYFNNEPDGSSVETMLKYYDKWGGPETYPHMSAGWAVAFDSPFTWTKQVASNYGGTRNGMVVRWPNGIKSKDEVRTQWHHVIDIVPTILEAVGVPEPRVVNGTPQRPIEGKSLTYSFEDAEAPDRRLVQYFEMFGNRGIYLDGWFAGTIHLKPWGKVENKFADDTWELYHVAEDFSMSENLAEKHPEKLAELQKAFLEEAPKYNVLPLDDRRQELFNPVTAGRPDLMFGRKSLTLGEGMNYLLENDFINIKNTSWGIIAEIESGDKPENGVITSQGGRFGGWSLYLKDGKPVFAYNYLGLDVTKASGSEALPKGKATIKMDFAYDGKEGDLGKGGSVTLSVNDKQVATAKVDKTQFAIFSADESAGTGFDAETPVVEDYDREGSRFTGKIDKVTISLKD